MINDWIWNYINSTAHAHTDKYFSFLQTFIPKLTSCLHVKSIIIIIIIKQ